ncbi:hypothetical protein LY76DRAFT_229770 [Colletotrichum caudatum]|nr:hypothetical protein LY76DRAFT_229770 [Colletotrichum caudatum]
MLTCPRGRCEGDDGARTYAPCLLLSIADRLHGPPSAGDARAGSGRSEVTRRGEGSGTRRDEPGLLEASSNTDSGGWATDRPRGALWLTGSRVWIRSENENPTKFRRASTSRHRGPSLGRLSPLNGRRQPFTIPWADVSYTSTRHPSLGDHSRCMG